MIVRVILTSLTSTRLSYACERGAYIWVSYGTMAHTLGSLYTYQNTEYGSYMMREPFHTREEDDQFVMLVRGLYVRHPHRGVSYTPVQ